MSLLLVREALHSDPLKILNQAQDKRHLMLPQNCFFFIFLHLHLKVSNMYFHLLPYSDSNIRLQIGLGT